MIEYSVKSLTMKYSEIEDRLKLDCVISGRKHSVWVTQRLLKLLIPSIVKRLVDVGLGSASAGDFIQDSFHQHKSSNVANASNPNMGLSAKLSSAGKKLDSGTGENALSHQTWLCTKAGIKFTDSGIRLTLQSSFFESSYVLAMSNLEASYLLLSLKDALSISEWEFDWPDWVSTNKDTELLGSRFVH